MLRLLLSSTVRLPLIHEGHELRTIHIAGFDSIEVKTGGADQLVYLAIEMASAADASPQGRQEVLPACHTWFWREAMLHKDQFPSRLEHAPHLAQRCQR